MTNTDDPPTQVTTYWCPRCHSHYIHDLGAGHVTQTAPALRCGTKLIPLGWFR